MPDDDRMDGLLREAMAGDVPRLSPAFDARLARRLRPRRLTPSGRIVMGLYVLVASLSAAWFMRGLPMEWIAAGLVIGVSAAAGASAYARILVPRA